MADTLRLDIPIDRSPLPAALDMFYDFVKGFAVPGPGDRVGILGSIINYDIHETARLYNDYVVRAFADRTARTSPVSSLGVGDLAERYSSRYVEMLKLLVAALDSALTPAAQEQIQRHRTTIRVVSSDRDKWLEEFEDSWGREMVRLGIDPTKIDTDPATRLRYFERRVVFMKQRKYADRLRSFNDDVEQEELAIEAIRISGYPDEEARQLVTLYKEAIRYQTIRPRRPDLELIYKWDELTIQNPEYRDMKDIFDVGPMIESIVDPRVILKGAGERSYSVKTSSVVTNNHDSDWNASGSGSYMSFIKGNFSTGSNSHFRSTVERVREVSIKFEHLGRLDISRGGWFSSQVFPLPRVAAFLKRDKVLAQKLALLTTGLIIGRGLTLTLFFKDKSDVHEWGSTSSSGGGGIEIMGIGFGGGGGSSSSWDNRKIDEATRTVTFTDGPNVCRLLGMHFNFIPGLGTLEQIAYGARPLSTIPALADAAQKLASARKLVEHAALFQ